MYSFIYGARGWWTIGTQFASLPCLGPALTVVRSLRGNGDDDANHLLGADLSTYARNFSEFMYKQIYIFKTILPHMGNMCGMANRQFHPIPTLSVFCPFWVRSSYKPIPVVRKTRQSHGLPQDATVGPSFLSVTLDPSFPVPCAEGREVWLERSSISRQAVLHPVLLEMEAHVHMYG